MYWFLWNRLLHRKAGIKKWINKGMVIRIPNLVPIIKEHACLQFINEMDFCLVDDTGKMINL
jgi:hypothetical protein